MGCIPFSLRGKDLELGRIYEMLFDGAQVHGPLDGVYPFPAGESHFNSLDHFLLLLSVS